MQTILNLGKIKQRFNRPAVAIGIFDGLHRGHQLILRKVVKFAKERRIKSIVITFFPHPAKEESLLSLKHRLHLIRGFGVDICVVIGFTKKFSRITAEEFVKDILVKKFFPEAVFVGKNFTFGSSASGNVKALGYLSNQYGFKLFSIPMVRLARDVISSTNIRAQIRNGNIFQAEKLIGRPVSVLGTVIKGSGWGRLWNVPTANINPHHEVLPAAGVYAVKIKFLGKLRKGICYVGRVSILKSKPRRIEVHIFNFHKKIYGKDLEILFVKKIRNELKFSSKEALIRQIRIDIKKAKNILKS